jgi:hypothetical protein
VPTPHLPASRYCSSGHCAKIEADARQCAANRRAIVAHVITSFIFQILQAILGLVSGILHAAL